MHKILLLASLCLSIALNAQYPGYKPVTDMPAFKAQFAAAAQHTQSIKSDFVQEKNLGMLSEKIISRGKFWFKKNNLVRMEYTQPFAYLVIINNNTVRIKDGQKENRVAAGSSKLFRQINRLMVDCVQGTALSNPDFRVSVFENAQSCLVELVPAGKALKDYFSHINIIVSKKDFTVNRLEMHEPSGDNTIISFVNKELNVALSDTLFAVQ